MAARMPGARYDAGVRTCACAVTHGALQRQPSARGGEAPLWPRKILSLVEVLHA